MENLNFIIKSQLLKKNLKIKHLAKFLHKTEQAVYVNLRRNNFSLTELKLVSNYLSLTDEDIVKCVKNC